MFFNLFSFSKRAFLISSLNLSATLAKSSSEVIFSAFFNTFDVSAASVIPEVALPAGFIPAGNYLPSNASGVAHNYTGFTFPCAAAGNWTLNISDNGGGDVGTLVDWAITTISGGQNYTHTLTGPGTATQRQKQLSL